VRSLVRPVRSPIPQSSSWRLPGRLGLLLVLLSCLAACSVPVAGGLDDAEANRVFVALDRSNIDATKEADPTGDGKWRVTVARDDLPRALLAMHDEGLPRRELPGVLDSIGKGALVPSEAAEHAQLVAGIAGELERSLEGIDGVLSARVHLDVPVPGPLRDGNDLAPPRGTASVLIEHRGATPPVSADSVQRLVAGGVGGLLATDVVVVMVPRATVHAFEGGGLEGDGLAHVGPIAVARASMRGLQAALVALVALVAFLAGATLVLYSRLTRARSALLRDAPP
jgi:type III secretion protein J